QQVRHAKAVNTNLRNQLNRGNFEIASVNRALACPNDLTLKKWYTIPPSLRCYGGHGKVEDPGS
ncbi:MAG: hypothetical protein WCP55_19115, partial [Lentisphaerota bacterium]